MLVWSPCILWVLWVFGQLLRDRSWLSGLLFYIPSAVLLVFLLVVSVWAWRINRRGRASLFATLALAPAIFVLCVENRLWPAQHQEMSETQIQLVHWNVCRGVLGWNGVADELRQQEADLYVLSEVPKNVDIRATAMSFGPEFASDEFSDLAVVARGSLRDGTWLVREYGVEAYGVVWESSQGVCRVVVVDLDASLHLAREPRLLMIRKLMVEWNADIIVGDFNAPRRSRAVSPLPTGFVHAYEAVGAGLSYTWPMPCPVYAIDQCILGPRIQPVDYDLESSYRSDHRRQVLKFLIVDGN